MTSTNRTRLLTALLCALLASLIVPGIAAGKAPRSFYGVIPQEALTGGDVAAISAAKIKEVRVDLNWGAIQQVNGRCQARAQVGICSWTQSDRVVSRIASAGARPVATLGGTPFFVSKKKPNKPPLKKKHLRKWKAFAKAAAKRYGRGGVFWESYSGRNKAIRDWQVWNEPNSRQFWSGKPNGRKYAKLVKATTKSLRRADRKVDVTLGGMFGNALVPLPKFMRQMYRVNKIKRFFDTISVHPYAANLKSLRRQVKQARRAARKGNHGGAKIKVSELGWSSKKGKHRLMKGRKGQAKMLRKSFRLLTKKRKAWKISGVQWFALRDTNNRDTCRFCRRSGLLTVNGKPKPAWRAFNRFIK